MFKKKNIIETNFHVVNRDFLDLLISFEKSYFTPIIQKKLPSKSALEYTKNEIVKSIEKIKDIDLGKYDSIFNNRYTDLSTMVDSYTAVEDKDMIGAIEINKKHSQTSDPYDFLEYSGPLKSILEQIGAEFGPTNKFLDLVNSVDNLIKQYVTHAVIYNTSKSIHSFTFKLYNKEERKIPVINPLRGGILNVVGKLDEFSIEAMMGGGSIPNFITGTNKLVDLCKEENLIYK